MKTVGIIAEYNPFHNGHQYQISAAKEATDADYVVVVMSGDFVQRGTPAFIDKYSRVKMALAAGADMVFELPCYYACASAEYFAKGGIGILHQLGFVDSVCFGCETPKIQELSQLASIISTEPNAYKIRLKELLSKGSPFPLARTQALCTYLKDCTEETLSDTIVESLLSSPNNILAIEYIKAIDNYKSTMVPVGIQRKESDYHSTDLFGTISSATAIRSCYQENQDLFQLSAFLPKESQTILHQQEGKTFPIHQNDFSSLLYYKLLHTADFTSYLDISEDFANKLSKYMTPQMSFDQFAEKCKSKDLVYTRVCRNLLHLLLGIKKEHIPEKPEYARLLGLKTNASSLLKQTKNFPVITKVSDATKQLTPEAMTCFQLDLACSHLYQHICFQKFGHSMPNEYQHSPIIAK